MGEVKDAGPLPCCNWLWSVDDLDGRLCVGVMQMSWPEYVCNACGARCGALAHPGCRSPEQATTNHPTASAGLAGTEGERGSLSVCTGAGDCPSHLHEHGCYADLDGSSCSDPDDHNGISCETCETKGPKWCEEHGRLLINFPPTTTPAATKETR